MTKSTIAWLALARDAFFAPGKWIGSVYVQAGTAVGLYVIGRYMLPHADGEPKTNKVSHLGFDMLRALIVSQAFTQGIKYAVRRDRPTGECCAFPSGHASATFATASVLERHLGLSRRLADICDCRICGNVPAARQSPLPQRRVVRRRLRHRERLDSGRPTWALQLCLDSVPVKRWRHGHGHSKTRGPGAQIALALEFEGDGARARTGRCLLRRAESNGRKRAGGDIRQEPRSGRRTPHGEVGAPVADVITGHRHVARSAPRRAE